MICYNVYGLTIASPFKTQLLVEAEPGEVDVYLRASEIPEQIDDYSQGKTFRSNGKQFLFPPIGNEPGFFVESPSSILVDAVPGRDDRSVFPRLLRSVLTAINYLRGRLVFHASSVVMEPLGVVAFLGRSGAGKSSLAHQFHESGEKVIGDDLVVVQDGRVCWSPPVLRLRPPSLNRDALPDKCEKRVIPLSAPQGGPLEVGLFCHLCRKIGEPELEELEGLIKARLLRRFLFRGGLLRGLSDSSDINSAFAALLSSVPVLQFRRDCAQPLKNNASFLRSELRSRF